VSTGPLPSEVFGSGLRRARANGQSKVLAEGATEWKTIAELPECRRCSRHGRGTISAPGPFHWPPVPRNNSFAVAGLTLGIIGAYFGFVLLLWAAV